VNSDQKLASDYARFMAKGKATFQRMLREGVFDPENVFESPTYVENMKFKDIYFLQADVFHGRPDIPPRYPDDSYRVTKPFVLQANLLGIEALNIRAAENEIEDAI
jgi:hypothetical protein